MSDKEKTPEKKSGKGFFNKLKSIAFESDESSENTTDTANTTSTVSEGQSKFVYSNIAPVQIGVPTLNGQFDDNFYQGLMKVMEDNNIEGVDYLEFSKSKRAMDSIPGMAEPIKYQSTFATLKANDSKLTKEYLLSTADVYIKKLDEESKEFDMEVQREINAEVVARNNKIQQKSDEIKAKQEQIAALTADINTLGAEIGATQAEAQSAQQKIDGTAKNFKVTFETVKSQINMDKQNIQNFIQ